MIIEATTGPRIFALVLAVLPGVAFAFVARHLTTRDVESMAPFVAMHALGIAVLEAAWSQ